MSCTAWVLLPKGKKPLNGEMRLFQRTVGSNITHGSAFHVPRSTGERDLSLPNGPLAQLPVFTSVPRGEGGGGGVIMLLEYS